jgi:hypothetical protein
LPQIIFQIYIFTRLQYIDEEKEELGISIEVILLSIVSAFLHGAIELLMIRAESSQALTTFMDYLLTSYNGRFGWLPYLSTFENDN